MAGPYIRTFWTVEGKVDKDGHPIEYPTEAAARAQSSGGGIGGTGIGAGIGPIPAAAPASKITEVMTEDGEYVQTTEGPDGQPQEIGRGVDKARLDLYQARQKAAPTALTPAQALDEARAGRAEERAGRAEDRAGRAETRAEQAQQREITAAEAAERARALREERANAIADRKMTIEEADRAYDRKYKEQVETPLKLAAEARAVAAAKRQEEQDRLEQERATRTEARTERVDTTRAREAELEFGYRGGQDAVKNAMELLRYNVNPQFLREFAAGLGTLSSGGGHVQFSPEAFQINLPDVDALATQGAQRAAALYHANTVPFTPAGAGVGAGPGPLQSSSAVTQQLNALPMAAQTAAAPAAVPASAGPSATPGIGAGAPSPLPPDWPWTSPTPANY